MSQTQTKAHIHEENLTQLPGNSSEGTPRNIAWVDGKTIPEAYLHRIQVSGDKPAFMVKRDGKYVPLSWKKIHGRVLGIFSLLKKLAIEPGDKVCIMGFSGPDWVCCDLAILGSRAVTVPIYPSNSVADISYILENCQAKMLMVESESFLEKIDDALTPLKKKIPIVLMAGESLDSTRGQGEEKSPLYFLEKDGVETLDASVATEFSKLAQEAQPQDLASIVYTSGTTGRPKGAMISHQNFTYELRHTVSALQFRPGDITLTFLPFAHILGRVESLFPIFSGVTLGFAENINTIQQNMVELRPTVLVSVPRIYEKIYSKIKVSVEASSLLKKKIFNWGLELGKMVARAESEKKSVSPLLLLKYHVADQMVFSKIRQAFGGRIRNTISGGAPLSQELCELFHACGIRILEGYGLTETTAGITVNLPHDYRFGTVGKPLPQSELRVAEDGEIQVKGPSVFMGYYGDTDATKEVFTQDGWFCTGDVGEIDDRGFLKITDRKKELIVTSGGKKVAPQKLENLIKSIPIVSNVMVYGDRQKYLVALITLNEVEAKKWLSMRMGNDASVSSFSMVDLSRDAKIQDFIQTSMETLNKDLASFESVKKFRILEADFTVETGELTPSLKIKRRVCVKRYEDVIQSLYS